VGAEALRDTRRVLHSGDGAVALSTVQAAGLDGPLQQVGELVLLALDDDAARACEFATKCSGVLRVRGWDGDQELSSLSRPGHPSILAPRATATRALHPTMALHFC